MNDEKEEEIKELRYKNYDIELKLIKLSKLYAKEKAEKESNSLAFKRIIEA